MFADTNIVTFVFLVDLWQQFINIAYLFVIFLAKCLADRLVFNTFVIEKISSNN